MACKGLITLCLLTGGCNGTLLEWPSNKTAVEGERVTLPCRTDLPVTVFWNFNNDDIFYARALNYKYVNKFEVKMSISDGVYNLVIQNVTFWHDGLYTCIDDDGEGEKRSARLTVTTSQATVTVVETPPELAINVAVIAIPIAIAVVIIVVVAISLIVCYKRKQACFSSTQTAKETDSSLNKHESEVLLDEDSKSAELPAPLGLLNSEESELTAETKNSFESRQTTQNKVVEQNSLTNSNSQPESDISEVASPEEEQQGSVNEIKTSNSTNVPSFPPSQHTKPELKPKPSISKPLSSEEKQSILENDSRLDSSNCPKQDRHRTPKTSESPSEGNKVAAEKVNMVEDTQEAQNQVTVQHASMASPAQQSSDSPEMISSEEKQQGSEDETKNHNSTNAQSPPQDQGRKPELKPKPSFAKSRILEEKQSIPEDDRRLDSSNCSEQDPRAAPIKLEVKEESTSEGNKLTVEKENEDESKQEAQNEVTEQLGATASHPQQSSDTPEMISSEEKRQDFVNKIKMFNSSNESSRPQSQYTKPESKPKPDIPKNLSSEEEQSILENESRPDSSNCSEQGQLPKSE